MTCFLSLDIGFYLVLAFIVPWMIYLCYLLIKSLRQKHKSQTEYDRLINQYNAKCLILALNVNGIQEIDSPCYILATNNSLKFVAAVGPPSTIDVPFSKIKYYSLKFGAYSNDLQTNKQRINYIASSLEFIYIYLDGPNKDLELYSYFSSLDEPQEFNKYAMQQCNFFDYIATKLPQKTEHIQL